MAQYQIIEPKLTHAVPTSSPTHKARENWAQSIERASGDSLRFKLFPDQELGKVFDQYDMVRDGIVDLAYTNVGYRLGRFPIIAAAELLF